jgi:hypothetical protein
LQDIVGNNDAPMVGTVPWYLRGSMAWAADLPDASANYFNADENESICDADMTIACWVSFDSPPTSAGDYEIIIARSKSGSDTYVFGIYCDSPNKAKVWWNVGGVDIFWNHGSALVADEVYHLVVTGMDGKAPGQWDLYINGMRMAYSLSSAAVPYTATDSYIGRREWAANEGEMNGKIYDLRVYDRPLTPEEVGWLYGIATRWAAYRVAAPLAGSGAAGGGPMSLSGLSGLSAFFAGG